MTSSGHVDIVKQLKGFSAADMEKGLAITHMIASIKEQQQVENLRVSFFDDAVLNTHSVACILESANHAELFKSFKNVDINCYWWDSFEEELGSPRLPAAVNQYKNELASTRRGTLTFRTFLRQSITSIPGMLSWRSCVLA